MQLDLIELQVKLNKRPVPIGKKITYLKLKILSSFLYIILCSLKIVYPFHDKCKPFQNLLKKAQFFR